MASQPKKGVFAVNESGVEFAYGDKEPDFATTPEEFLDHFRYVHVVFFCFVFITSCVHAVLYRLRYC
jgi:hypothetical protein